MEMIWRWYGFDVEMVWEWFGCGGWGSRFFFEGWNFFFWGGFLGGIWKCGILGIGTGYTDEYGHYDRGERYIGGVLFRVVLLCVLG